MPDIKSIGDIYSSDKTLSNLRNFIQKTDVVVKFAELFPDLKKIAKATKLEKNVLYLSVESSIWRSELKFKQKIIIERINTHFQCEIVKSVKFTG